MDKVKKTSTSSKPKPHKENRGGPRPNSGGARKGAGRKPVAWPISKGALEAVCRLQVTDTEIAKIFNVSPPVITQWKKKDPKFARILTQAAAQGRLSLRRMMFKCAVKDGSAPMAIHLSKHWLGMRDKPAMETSVDNVITQEQITEVARVYIETMRAIQRNAAPEPQTPPSPLQLGHVIDVTPPQSRPHISTLIKRRGMPRLLPLKPDPNAPDKG